MDLKDKVVLITGSSSGIGKTTAIRFAKEGAIVIATYHINETGGMDTLKEIEKYSEGMLVKTDVSSETDLDKLVNTVINKYGKIDILINNAASPTEKVSFDQASQSDFLELLNLNIVSAMKLSQLVINYMKDKGGKIINTSSIKGWEHGGGSITYAVSKAAINSFTRTLAKQVAPKILVNAVAPGYVKTRVYDNQPEDKIKKWLDGTYLKRWVTEDEIADAFIFLAKNDAMTGQVIYVDGGFTLK